jgi:hypothetical protein
MLGPCSSKHRGRARCERRKPRKIVDQMQSLVSMDVSPKPAGAVQLSASCPQLVHSTNHNLTSMPARTDTPTTLSIAIIGSGLGGLSAAVALRRQNHKVVIFERYDFGGEVGASLSRASNSSKFLQEWNVPIASTKPVKLKSLIMHQKNGWWRRRRRREKVCRAPLTVGGVPEGVCGKLVSDAEAREA